MGSSVEKLSISVLDLLIDVLEKYRGDFLRAVCNKVAEVVVVIEDHRNLDRRYKFESVALTSLKRERPDFSLLIEFCEVDLQDVTEPISA